MMPLKGELIINSSQDEGIHPASGTHMRSLTGYDMKQKKGIWGDTGPEPSSWFLHEGQGTEAGLDWQLWVTSAGTNDKARPQWIKERWLKKGHLDPEYDSPAEDESITSSREWLRRIGTLPQGQQGPWCLSIKNTCVHSHCSSQGLQRAKYYQRNPFSLL